MSLSFKEVCDNVKNETSFTLSRFGDGEWRAITGHSGANCDGHEYFPDMSNRLREIVAGEKNYYWGCHLESTQADREEIEDYMSTNDLNIKWDCCSGIFHEEIKHGTIGQFIKSLWGRNVLLVGPKYLNKVIDCEHIVVSQKNCWAENKRVTKQLYEYAEKQYEYVVLFCSSMAANVWIDDFHGHFHTLIDLGSGLDYHAKNGIRSFIRKRLAKDEA